MRSIYIFVLAAFAHISVGCAQSPERIRPSYASPVFFRTYHATSWQQKAIGYMRLTRLHWLTKTKRDSTTASVCF